MSSVIMMMNAAVDHPLLTAYNKPAPFFPRNKLYNIQTQYRPPRVIKECKLNETHGDTKNPKDP